MTVSLIVLLVIFLVKVDALLNKWEATSFCKCEKDDGSNPLTD